MPGATNSVVVLTCENSVVVLTCENSVVVSTLPRQERKMEFVTSQKRQQKLIHEGYVYVFQKDLANDLRSFECVMRRTGQCKAKLKVDV